MFAQRMLGPRAHLKDAQKEENQYNENKQVVPNVPYFLLFFQLIPISSVELYFISVLCGTRRVLFGFPWFLSLTVVLELLPKLKTNTISVSLASYQFLRCVQLVRPVN